MSISDIVSIFSFLLLLFSIPSVRSLSFNLSSIGPSQSSSFNLTGYAYISKQGIQVTPDERNIDRGQRVGRATYIEPLHLWDRLSGKLTDFSTHFSMVIDSRGSPTFADGLTLFMAPNGSNIMPWSVGGNLGIGNSDSMVNSSSQAFVAVEFDTFPNSWDSHHLPHVGIDINSMRSVVTEEWQNNITLGAQNDVWIGYNSSSKTLRVDFTGFSGNRRRRQSISHVVDLREFLPEYVTFGFSAATGDWFEKHNVKSWEFSSSNLLQVDGGVSSHNVPNVSSQVPSPSPDPPVMISTGRGQANNKGLVLGLSFGLSTIILASVFASYCLWWRKKKNKKSMEPRGDEDFFDPSVDNEFEKGTGPKKFSYSELVLATKSFAEEEKLGEGGFGGVYRGFLRETNTYVAVKRVSRGSKQGVKEYASEVKIISQLRHRNLVQLIGWCHQTGELMLVYDLMPNGSLDSHLFKEKSSTPLSGEQRYKIAQGVASALLYLHEEWEQCVVHRDIKTSNIMLDSNFNAKLGDFGLARLVDHEKGSQTTVLAGTIGYMAPECIISGRCSKESDVYSFGIVLLEIASGRRPVDCQENRFMTLVEWVWSLHGTGELLHAVDPMLETEYNAREMERLMVVGLWCVHPDSTQRPSIRQTIHVLNFESDLPALPPLMPVASYLNPRFDIYSSNVGDSLSYNCCSNSSNVTTSASSSTTLILTT